jgi:hypothetical protein
MAPGAADTGAVKEATSTISIIMTNESDALSRVSHGSILQIEIAM